MPKHDMTWMAQKGKFRRTKKRHEEKEGGWFVIFEKISKRTK